MTNDEIEGRDGLDELKATFRFYPAGEDAPPIPDDQFDGDGSEDTFELVFFDRSTAMNINTRLRGMIRPGFDAQAFIVPFANRENLVDCLRMTLQMAKQEAAETE